MDSGIDANHPEFNGRLSNGNSKIYRLFDFVIWFLTMKSPGGDHGTCCAGVAEEISIINRRYQEKTKV